MGIGGLSPEATFVPKAPALLPEDGGLREAAIHRGDDPGGLGGGAVPDHTG